MTILRRSPLFLLLAGASNAAAQSSAAPIPAEKTSAWGADFKTAFYSNEPFSDIGENLSLSRVGVDLLYSTDALGGLWNFRLGLEESDYRSSDSTFTNAKEAALGATFTRQNERWSWFATLNLNEGDGDRADFGDGTYFEGGGGIGYAFGDTLVLGLGVIGRTQLEEDPALYPMPLVEWTLSERARIGTVHSSDPSFGFTYQVSPQLDAYLDLVYQQRQYRVAPGVMAHAAFVDEEQGLRTGLIYHLRSDLRAELYVGEANRRLLLSVDGNQVANEHVDTALAFGLGFTWGV